MSRCPHANLWYVKAGVVCADCRQSWPSMKDMRDSLMGGVNPPLPTA